MWVLLTHGKYKPHLAKWVPVTENYLTFAEHDVSGCNYVSVQECVKMQ